MRLTVLKASALDYFSSANILPGGDILPFSMAEYEAALRERVHYAEGTADANIQRANEVREQTIRECADLFFTHSGPHVAILALLTQPD